ncbi:MAG TPA: Crp/Fnr family transcriptional regulator [Anaerolineae bacterium]|nr:Crp/Fnr family transcriptional regulator [Anaerolineae bacterium]
MAGTRLTISAAQVLSAVPYFTELLPKCAATFENLAREAVRRDYNVGQAVFLEGEPCAGLYVVEAGWLKSVKALSSGREQTVRIVGPGEVFNSTGVLIESSKNLVTVVALEPATVWLVRRESLLRLMDRCPPLARIITRQLAERVEYLVSLIEDLSLRPVEARLARLLLEQSATNAMPRRRWATQTEMAARLGTVPDVLNRALRSLADEGLIRVERHQIQILDREGLKTRAMLEA